MLNNLTIKHCDISEKLKTILVKNLLNSETERLVQNVILKLKYSSVRRIRQRLRNYLETFCLRAKKHSNGSHMKRLFSLTWKIALQERDVI